MKAQTFPKGLMKEKTDYSVHFLNYSVGFLAIVLGWAIFTFGIAFFFFPADLGGLYADVFNAFKTNLR